MKSRFRSILQCSLAIAIVASSGELSSEENETIKFSFAPGDKTSFIQKLSTSKEKDMGTKGTQLDEFIGTTRITISRTGAGWDVLAEPKGIHVTRNGKVVDNPIVNLLSSAVITYKLDPDGNIVDVEGYEAFIEGISKQLPAQVFKQLAPVINVEAMKAKEIAEWNGRFGNYLGAEVAIGDSFVAKAPFQLPNGSTAEYNVKTIISAIEPCAETNCVRIDQIYDAEADDMAKTSGEVLNNLVKEIVPGGPKSRSENNSARISGNVQRLIDPKTMLIYREEVRRVIDMTIDIPGEGLMPLKMTETRSYEFEY